MARKLRLILALTLALFLLAGCGGKEETPQQTVPLNIKTETVSPTEETVPLFTAYDLSVESLKLAIHSGPGYSYEILRYITDQGIYTIVSESIEKLEGGAATVWGKLESGGWVNLEDALAEAETTEPSTEASTAQFEPYLFQVANRDLQIYSGPGYDYIGNGSITDKGTYTIVEESIQYFDSGRQVTWGRLKSGAGWICLDDAKIVTDLGPPYRCKVCGRADVYISRYAMCEQCHKEADAEAYGTCIYCGEPLTYEEYCKPWNVCDDCPTDFYDYCSVCGDALTIDEITANDGTICFDCLVCWWCGDRISITDVTAFGTYMCWSCYEEEYCCDVCGADCFYRGTIYGMCEDCYDAIYNSTDYCTSCGVELTDWNTAYNGFGQCTDCYYKNLDPEYICDLCGADCSFRGSIDGLCEDCYDATHQDP